MTMMKQIPPAQSTIDARELIGENATIQIVLDDQTYTLRITRQNKLILTK